MLSDTDLPMWVLLSLLSHYALCTEELEIMIFLFREARIISPPFFLLLSFPLCLLSQHGSTQHW